MPSKSFVSLVAVAISVSTAGLTFANNNLFLPGDAFFPCVLTKAGVEALHSAKAGERTFEYSSFGGYPAAFCGYAGYNLAKIKAIDDAFAANLAKAYRRIREFSPRTLIENVRDGKEELVETNGMPVLFYAADYPFPKRPLGLRYNENWIAETVKFGHKRDHVRLCCLIQDAAAVEEEWRDAEAVPPLKVKVPDAQPNPDPEKRSKAHVEVQGAVKAIVLADHTLQELYSYTPLSEASPTIFVVDSNGVVEMICEAGNWKMRDEDKASADDEPEAKDADEVGVKAWR